MALEVIVLAAGQGTRMRSNTPKVLHTLGGTPLLQHVLDAVFQLSPEKVHVVHGHGGEHLQQHFVNTRELCWVLQAEQMGTAHAVSCALPEVSEDHAVLVVYGDIPMITAGTLETLVSESGSSLALLTAEPEDPRQYGRIIRNEGGQVTGIVEYKDADENQRRIREINTGFMAAPANQLRSLLSRVDNRNAKGEYYLTDVVSLAYQEGLPVYDVKASDATEIAGVNTRYELALLEREYQRRRARALCEQGVTVIDPSRLDMRGPVKLGRDSLVDVNVVMEGTVNAGENTHIGSNCFLRDVVIGDNVRIRPNSVIEQAVIGDNAIIGPFARIRPGSRLEANVHIGNFVEIKNAEVGDGAKINHLSYVGDSSVGSGTNIGAGCITCNYDGANKHRTDIGENVFVGSNSQLVAPVKVGRGATVGAGSTITQDVPESALAVSRARQRNITGWQRPKKTKG